ncbi:MAG: glycine cleavage system protein GcvH [Bacteroidales bacterium]|nr:glycine cleavage system protein GcvH [Bacteroidales bacterium]
MKVPDNLRFTENHEWLRIENGHGYIGVTDFAQSELGDVVFLEVETVGESLTKGEAFGTIEAVKTVSDIFMPVSGEILEFNEALSDQPELINKDPYGDGWIVKIRISNPAEVDELLDADKYRMITEA